MQVRFTLADYLMAAIIGMAIGAGIGIYEHRSCAIQAEEVREYLSSESYQQDLAAHAERLHAMEAKKWQSRP